MSNQCKKPCGGTVTPGQAFIASQTGGDPYIVERRSHMFSKMKAERITELLKDPLNVEFVHDLVAPDATYVSLNFENAELKKIMPWAGTGKGPQAVLDTYAQVGQYWTNEELKITDSVESGDSVAVFGAFTYKSVTVHKTITSPFCIFAKFKKDQIVYMQFMADTFGTASTFRTGGVWRFHSDPKGQEMDL